MQVLEGRIDHSRVVALVRRGGHLGLAKDYLVAVQKNNLTSVNEAMNEVRPAAPRCVAGNSANVAHESTCRMSACT